MSLQPLLRLLVALGLALGGLVLLASPASAQANLTWVSGVGDDANPCSRTAPCKTWAGAISKTAVGGQINALDPGSYGSVTITKAITLNGAGMATVLSAGTSGIIVNAPATAQVLLRGLELKGVNAAEGTCSGLTGVQIVGAAAVRLEDMDISGYARAVDAPLTGSALDVNVDITLDDVSITNNCEFGVRLAPDAGHPGRLSMDDSSISQSNTALHVAAGGEAWVGSSQIVLNNIGVQSAGGPIHSLCNNQVAGNATDGAFTDAIGCAQVVAPPTTPPTTTTYCTVPKLKNKTKSQAETALVGAGCALGKVTKQSGPASKKGKVYSQQIPKGFEVKLGTKVGITVYK